MATTRGGSLHQEYVHGPGIDTPWALLDYSGGPAQVYYYHADYLGSIRALTDASQTVAQSYTYTAFGQTTVGNPTGLDQPFRYTAREWDDAAGLYYYRARWYDTVAGRFSSQDPIRWAGGVNLYMYVLNAPTNWKDPTGEFTFLGWLGMGLGLLGGAVFFSATSPAWIAAGLGLFLAGGALTIYDMWSSWEATKTNPPARNIFRKRDHDIRRETKARAEDSTDPGDGGPGSTSSGGDTSGGGTSQGACPHRAGGNGGAGPCSGKMKWKGAWHLC